MKNAIRLFALMVAFACTCWAVTAPMLPAPDGGPIPVCGPHGCT